MLKCKTAVAPWLMHWSYCSLALSHRHGLAIGLSRNLATISLTIIVTTQQSFRKFGENNDWRGIQQSEITCLNPFLHVMVRTAIWWLFVGVCLAVTKKVMVMFPVSVFLWYCWWLKTTWVSATAWKTSPTTQVTISKMIFHCNSNSIENDFSVTPL